MSLGPSTKDDGWTPPCRIEAGRAVLFDVNISGRDFPRGKPDLMIFLTAAEELDLWPTIVRSSRDGM